jgi:toxin-antitoxin system PIN domain toxin
MPDVNVLVYAHREDDPFSGPYRRWLDDVVAGPAPFALSVLVAVAFLRVVTNRRIYDPPTPLPLALAAIDALTARSNCQLVLPGPRHWDLVAALCRRVRASGAQVADAQHAALAIESGCEWVTRDADFAPFEEHGLRWRHLVLP